MSTHTPGPWRISDCQLGEKLLIEHGDEDTRSPVIGAVYTDGGRLPQQANAAFIVRACNSHAAMLEALKAVAALPGFEPSETYGVKVKEAIRLAEGRS